MRGHVSRYRLQGEGDCHELKSEAVIPELEQYILNRKIDLLCMHELSQRVFNSSCRVLESMTLRNQSKENSFVNGVTPLGNIDTKELFA